MSISKVLNKKKSETVIPGAVAWALAFAKTRGPCSHSPAPARRSAPPPARLLRWSEAAPEDAHGLRGVAEVGGPSVAATCNRAGARQIEHHLLLPAAPRPPAWRSRRPAQPLPPHGAGPPARKIPPGGAVSTQNRGDSLTVANAAGRLGRPSSPPSTLSTSERRPLGK